MKRTCSLLLLTWMLLCCLHALQHVPAPATADDAAATASTVAESRPSPDSEWQWQLVRSTLMAIPADGTTTVTQVLARTTGSSSHPALKRTLPSVAHTAAVSRAQFLSFQHLDRHLAAISHADGMDIYGRCQMRC